MEDKRDNRPCEDVIGRKRRVRKTQFPGKVCFVSTSAGGRTAYISTAVAKSDQIKTSNFGPYEEENLNGQSSLPTKRGNIEVKEYVSSGEEETFTAEGEENVFTRKIDTSSGKRKEKRSVRKVTTFRGKREENVSGEKKGHLSFVEEETSYKNTNLGENKSAFSQNYFGFQHKQRNKMSKFSIGGSREEDTSSEEGDSEDLETVIVGDSSVSERKLGQDRSKFNIGRSKEMSEDLRKQVVEAHRNGKGYKRIAKDLDLKRSTVRSIVHKWKKFSTVATLPRSGRPTKISAKARHTIIKHMTENTRVTVKDLKASLTLNNINVHESTIRKTLSKWCSWDYSLEEATVPQQE